MLSKQRVYLFYHQIFIVFNGLGVAELVEAFALLRDGHSPRFEELVLHFREGPEEDVLVAGVDQGSLVHEEFVHQDLDLAEAESGRTVHGLHHLVVLGHHPQAEHQEGVDQGELMRQSQDGGVHEAVPLESLVQLDQLLVNALEGGAHQSPHLCWQVGKVSLGSDGFDLAEFGQQDVHVVGVFLAHEEGEVEETKRFVAILAQDEGGRVGLKFDQFGEIGG